MRTPEPGSVMADALAHLIELVDHGGEFPSAVYKTTLRYSLSGDQVERLEQLYDEVDS
jgi:hypothetical protein